MMDDTHVLDSLPAYALGSLDEEEKRLVEEHVLGCHICRQELDEFQVVADNLLLAVPEALPPAALKGRLTERIQRLNRTPTKAPPGWRFPWPLPVGAIAAIVLIVILGISNLIFWQRLNTMEVITGPLGMRAVALQNTEAASKASGFVIISANGDDGVLVVDELPQLDESHEYQVWLMREGVSTSAALFSVDEGGYRGMRLTSPESLLLYSEVGVTIEPAGGSTSPTGEQVLRGSLFNP